MVAFSSLVVAVMGVVVGSGLVTSSFPLVSIVLGAIGEEVWLFFLSLSSIVIHLLEYSDYDGPWAAGMHGMRTL